MGTARDIPCAVPFRTYGLHDFLRVGSSVEVIQKRMRPRKPKGLAGMLIVLSLSAALSACEDEVNPFIESDRYFTVWGNLDMRLDTQYVRLLNIGTELEPSGEALDAMVRTTDLVTGSVTTWMDSLYVFADGTVGHIFQAPLRIQANHRYRFQVEGSDRSSRQRQHWRWWTDDAVRGMERY
jgi:hypothetical protein